MEYLLQADTFDEELKKLFGMGFEKVFQALSFSISVPYSSHLAYGAGTAYCMFWLYLVFFFELVSGCFILRDPLQSGSANKLSVFHIGCACLPV